MKPLDPKLLKLAAPARWYVILTAAFGAASAALVIAQALLIAAAIAPVISQGRSLSDVATPLYLLAGVVVARALVTGLSERYAHRASIAVIIDLRRQVLSRAIALGPRWLSLPTPSGSNGLDVVNLATRGLDDLRPYFVRYLPQLLLSATVTPAAIAVVFGIDWISGLIIVGTIPLIPIFMILVGYLTQKTSEKRLATMSRLGSQVLDLIAGLPTLRAFGREIGPIKRVKQLGEAYARSTMRTLQVAFLSGMVLELLTTLSVALVAVSVGLRLVYGYIGLEMALVIIMLAPEVYLPLRNVGTQFHASTNGIAAFNAAVEVLEQTPRPIGTRRCPALDNASFTFRDASVAAPGRELLAPAGLNARIEPHHITAITGASGAGKTTSVLALLGLVALDGGSITVESADESVPVDQIEPQSLWSQVTWLTQRAPLPPGPLHAALLADAQPGHATTTAHVESTTSALHRALEMSGFDEVVAELPEGLDTVIGSGGLGLSVGQRQRLVLAKALLSSAPVLILDEPTAHLDAATQDRVLTALDSLRAQGRTIIVIAHREALIARADHVIEVSAQHIVSADVPKATPSESTAGRKEGSHVDS
ncbi:thiol reductant ABC exporter subunit CydD [Populibacterium corticicola]|uniref:Thiol reductant ABC exporter subunit CydD n=1 Tax=Populibacterium corticicola TaxID=1812826 RepID=A0ABW5XDY5_9MICO